MLSEHREYLIFLVRELRLNPNDCDQNGQDAVTYCYLSGLPDLERELPFLTKDLGASVDMPSLPQGRSQLLDAAMRGHLELFDFLLRNHADVTVHDNHGRGIKEYIKMDYAERTSLPKTQKVKDQLQ